jgi:hypothetical protein
VARCTSRDLRGVTPQLEHPGVFVKLVRVLIAAAVAVVAATAFQLASSSAGATDGPDCIGCWGSQINQH